MNPTKLDLLVEILKDAPDEVFIQPHNVPDPDAIAASLGLYYLLSQRGIQKLAIVYDQEIEKANSQNAAVVVVTDTPGPFQKILQFGVGRESQNEPDKYNRS
ncbi:MAG: hypothetical protein LBH43_07525 [Treponema sp.]|jgi:c-di-AMP phosphodiesterase-like protein|nr:hypothetical protein [Treponema sp.]